MSGWEPGPSPSTRRRSKKRLGFPRCDTRWRWHVNTPAVHTHSLEFYIDIHAHSTSKSSFFFVNDPHDDEDVGAWERVAALPKLMDHNCAQLDAPGFSLSACRFCSNPDKAGTGRRAVGDMARAAHIKRTGAKARPAGQDYGRNARSR